MGVLSAMQTIVVTSRRLVLTIGIEPLKATHDVTKLYFKLSLLCIDINLSIQLISLALYMTWVH